MPGDGILAQRHHLLRRVGDGKQSARRFVDAHIGGLGRENHRHQQRERIHMLKLAFRLRPLHGKAAEDFAHLGRRVAVARTPGRRS